MADMTESNTTLREWHTYVVTEPITHSERTYQRGDLFVSDDLDATKSLLEAGKLVTPFEYYRGGARMKMTERLAHSFDPWYSRSAQVYWLNKKLQEEGLPRWLVDIVVGRWEFIPAPEPLE